MWLVMSGNIFFFFQAEDGIRDYKVTGVQTCALPICIRWVNYLVDDTCQLGRRIAFGGYFREQFASEATAFTRLAGELLQHTRDEILRIVSFCFVEHKAMPLPSARFPARNGGPVLEKRYCKITVLNESDKGLRAAHTRKGGERRMIHDNVNMTIKE